MIFLPQILIPKIAGFGSQNPGILELKKNIGILWLIP